MRILCVAEKPSASKQIAEILSQRSFRTESTSNRYIKNYTFDYTINNRTASMVVTALLGHLTGLDFNKEQYGWTKCDPDTLFHAPTYRNVLPNQDTIAENLKRQARNAEVLFIWTDCDREGEGIGAEVKNICTSVNPRLEIWRARFSSFQGAAIHQAARTPDRLDMRLVDAVNTREELDLRIGAAFTRLQTLKLQHYLADTRQILSYGSCQFPTLGFVVDRYMAIQKFVPEDFWQIDMEYTHHENAIHGADMIIDEGAGMNVNKKKDGDTHVVKFNWKRNRLFDYWAAFILYEACYQNPLATVTAVRKKQITKRKPLPLTTVELQKTANRMLHIPSDVIMTIAESLYNRGLISYPRTETDEFDDKFDFMKHVQMQVNDRDWGRYAQLIRDGEFERPRKGGHNDKAHPPIHPTGYDQSLSGNDKRVYEFIARRFLACCWKDALGFETVVEAQITTEDFDARGLIILERNFLEVYTYDKWKGNYLPDFEQGDQFMPSSLLLNSGTTSAPSLLKEYDLIALMEKNEIGTDATIADHIKKIQDRMYAYKENEYFHPTTLGIALILGYDEIGFETSLSKPFLRREMEADLKRICQGTIEKANVIQQSLEKYRSMYGRTLNELNKLVASLRTHYRPDQDSRNHANSNQGSPSGFNSNNSDTSSSTSRRGRGRGRGRGSRSSGNTNRGSRGGRGRGSNSNNRSRGRGRGANNSNQ